MFLEKQSCENLKKYSEILKAVGSLSNLFSENTAPYLSYRATENIFCEVFGAENLSRSDCSADASKDGIGFGIKTFINDNGRSFQKVAEFNKDSSLYRSETPKEFVLAVANLRNERIRATKRIHNLDKLIYHCIVREPGKIKIFECNMDEIDIKKIKNIKPSKNSIAFEDGINEYTFNRSKSTLYKRFITENILLYIDVEILENPYDLLKKLTNTDASSLIFEKIKEDKKHIFLPLFSDRGPRNVPERSGLNQWNAEGRKRDFNEVYIPIPAIINKNFPDFFPGRDIVFDLMLPDGNVLSAKVCQDGNKALMSNPNQALGKWILRTVMNLKEGELLTYEKLEQLGLDSVVIYKEAPLKYSINFTQIGSYDMFIENNL